MLLGRPDRPATSRSGSASPDDRNAESSCEAWTTDLTRYGSRALAFCPMAPSRRDELEGIIIWMRERDNSAYVSHDETPSSACASGEGARFGIAISGCQTPARAGKHFDSAQAAIYKGVR